MALQKSKTLTNGATGDYWKIVGIALDRLAGSIIYNLALFMDQAHAQAGATPLAQGKQYKFQITEEQQDGNLVAFGYASIKSQAASMVLPLGGKPGDQEVVFDADLSGASDI